MKQLQETFAIVERIAVIAVHRLGGTLRVKDEEWLAAQDADMQWRTVRMPGLEPEVHVACTLQGEGIPIGKAVGGKGGDSGKSN